MKLKDGFADTKWDVIMWNSEFACEVMRIMTISNICLSSPLTTLTVTAPLLVTVYVTEFMVPPSDAVQAILTRLSGKLIYKHITLQAVEYYNYSHESCVKVKL